MKRKFKLLSLVAVLVLIGIVQSFLPLRQNARNAIADKEGSLPVYEHLFKPDQPFAQCHASTVVHLNDGSFIAAWFGGTREKAKDVGIWMTKGTPGHWERPFEVAKVKKDVAHWNPVLFQAADGKVFLFFKMGIDVPHWETWVKTSDDNGQSWSEARKLFAEDDHDGRGPVRNKPIVLSNGDIIAGASNEKGVWQVFFDRSTDNGRTWKATDYVQMDTADIKGVIQPTLWESAPGQVHALLRSKSGFICRTDSKDYGKTWSPVYKTSLPNNNSGIDLTRLPSGNLVLAFNPSGENWGSRGTLELALSKDNGRTWTKKIALDNGKTKDEYSYPAVISYGDTIAVTYTWNRKTIAFWNGTEKWLLHHANL